MLSLSRTGSVALLCLALALPATADGGAGGFWRSLLIPGWGQQAQDQSSSAVRFAATEVALWVGYVGLRTIHDVRKTTYRTYASTHSGARTQGKNSLFFDDLGFYASQQQHNQFARVDDGPNAQLYPDSAEFSWEWDADSSRERYRTLRNSAQTMERNALYVTGAIVVNHLVAAIHAARGGRSITQQAQALAVDWQLQPDRMDLTLRRRF